MIVSCTTSASTQATPAGGGQVQRCSRAILSGLDAAAGTVGETKDRVNFSCITGDTCVHGIVHNEPNFATARVECTYLRLFRLMTTTKPHNIMDSQIFLHLATYIATCKHSRVDLPIKRQLLYPAAVPYQTTAQRFKRLRVTILRGTAGM